MKKLYVIVLTAVLSYFLFGTAIAGYLHPDVAQEIANNPGQTYYSVIVSLEDQAPIPEIDASLKNANSTLKERHEVVIRTLQQKVAETQPAFVELLEAAKTLGEVSKYQSFWLINGFRIDATENFIRKLADRDDVKEVGLNYLIEDITPVEQKKDDRTAAGVENGLQAIHAPEAWARGYTGLGRLASHLDTGVDGNHPALASRWRGLDPGYSGHPDWAWYDPVTYTTFPFDSGIHGTHTMGTICGADHSTGDTVGVAFDAEWISAGVIDRVDIPTTMADAFTAFQWIADPDGNPSTDFDVPDVCSNSWGLSPIYHSQYTYPCDPYFWNVIDNCEAAGVAVVFAAGNEGPGSNTLRTPADRGSTPYNSFAVGAVDGNTSGYPIASFSSRGPSPCGPYTTKPEVVAPGVNVRSCYPGGGYYTMSGTSMATPHVAGAVLILRQADPNATVDEIKEALLMTADDLGPSGEDNTYGWGIINIDAALDYLGAPGPDVTINMIPDNSPVFVEPGGSFTYTGILTNNTDQYQTVDVWIMLDVPGYGMYGPVQQYNNVSLSPNQTMSVSGITQYVPTYAPYGSYNYIAYCGDYPNNIISSASFPFTVQVSGGGLADFENIPEDFWYYGGNQNLGCYYAGICFGPGVTILENEVYGYNDYYYPPHSGHAVAFTNDYDYIRVDFDSPVNHVGVWYTTGSDYLYLEGYDSGDNLIASTYGTYNTQSTSFMQINTNNIAYVKIHDSGDFFTIDDFEWSPSSVKGNNELADSWLLKGWFDTPAGELAGNNTQNIPADFALSNNYPNPFNASTTISFQLPSESRVKLEVFNLLGEKVESLANGTMSAGKHSIIWNAGNYSSGIYFYRLTAGDKVVTKKMNLLK